MRVYVCDFCGKRIKEEDGKILGKISMSALRTDGKPGYTKSKCYDMCLSCSEEIADILRKKAKEDDGK